MSRPSLANTEATVETILRSLPGRLRPGTDAFQGTFHWVIGGASQAEWTVRLDAGRCEVLPGLVGVPDCVTSMSEEVFLGIETGARNPVSAYMKGRIKVSNVSKLRRYEQLFYRFHDVAAADPESVAEPALES